LIPLFIAAIKIFVQLAGKLAALKASPNALGADTAFNPASSAVIRFFTIIQATGAGVFCSQMFITHGTIRSAWSEHNIRNLFGHLHRLAPPLPKSFLNIHIRDNFIKDSYKHFESGIITQDIDQKARTLVNFLLGNAYSSLNDNLILFIVQYSVPFAA
jgi:hypothetical protein